MTRQSRRPAGDTFQGPGFRRGESVHFDEAADSDTDAGVGVKRARSGRFGHTYAAVDLGTNNCRLLIARPTRDGFRVIDAFSRIVRLGEGVHASGRLAENAMDRTVDALKACAEKMQRRRVTRARAVATEACRRAGNGAAFVARVEAETGIRLDIIGGGEEAALALAGCAPLLDPRHRHAIVIDIGGGSTEVMWLELKAGFEPRMLGWVSLPCGVVNLAERFGGDRVPAGTYEAMVREVTGLLAPFETEQRIAARLARHRVQTLGTSGTVTTIAGVLLDLPRYLRSRVDGRWLDFPAVLATARRLAGMTVAERAAHPCIREERADLVVAGCAILEAVHRTWPTQKLRVADRGVREGVLMQLIEAADRETTGDEG